MTVTEYRCTDCGDIMDLTEADIAVLGYVPDLCEDCDEEPLTEADVEAHLVEMLDALASVHPDERPESAEFLEGARVQSYGSAGALTMNKGVWITLASGQRLQLTIHLG